MPSVGYHAVNNPGVHNDSVLDPDYPIESEDETTHAQSQNLHNHSSTLHIYMTKALWLAI